MDPYSNGFGESEVLRPQVPVLGQIARKKDNGKKNPHQIKQGNVLFEIAKMYDNKGLSYPIKYPKPPSKNMRQLASLRNEAEMQLKGLVVNQLQNAHRSQPRPEVTSKQIAPPRNTNHNKTENLKGGPSATGDDVYQQMTI